MSFDITNSRYRVVRMHGLGDVLREHRRSRPSCPAVVDGDYRLNYLQLDTRVNQLAHVLRDRGVASGERVLWLGQNSFRILETLLACAKLGAALCPINWRMSPAETEAVIEDFDPRVLIWQQGEVGTLSESARRSDTPRRTWIQHDTDGPGGYESLLAAAADQDDDERVDADLPLLALFTAAFEGRPNAALLSHSAILYQDLIIGRAQAIDDSSVVLNSGPLFHLGTLMGTLAAFHWGGCNIFLTRMDAEQLLRTIATERVTHAFIPQVTIEQVRAMNADGRYDVSSLWSTPQAREWTNPMCAPAHAPMARFLGGYGQTEMMGLAVLKCFGGQGTAGRPNPMLQLRIVDPQGDDAPAGTAGEIVVRGPLVMSGYHGQDAENARRTAGGWHHTNDLGVRQEDGSITFIGPKTTMIKSGVENIYPAEVENALRTHPAVADVCVIGVPDPVWDQSVKAVVVLKPGQSLTADELIEHSRSRIASYKKPRYVQITTALPRSADGALDRKAVDAAFGGGGYPAC